MKPWTLTRRRVVFEHPYVNIIVDELERDGTAITYHYLESPVDSVAAVAVTAGGGIVLTRQYRHPLGQVIFDLPAGRANPGENPADAARRELAEETGYTPGVIISLGRTSPFPGSIKVTQHLFFAHELVPGEQSLDHGEELEVHIRPFEEVYREVLAGQHLDGALQMGVLLARARGLA
jgi:ADP-ribose pyrophosphatase